MRTPLLAFVALVVVGAGTYAVVALSGGESAASTPAGQWASSVFSAKLPATPASATSTEGFVGDLVTDYRTDYGAVGINQLPIWTIGRHQATVAVVVTSGCNDFRSDTGSRVPIPPAATTTGTGDSPLIIYQPSTHTDWELWRAKPVGNGSWTACSGGKVVTTHSPGVFPSPWGLSGSGISYLATTVTEADVASGVIRHAISVDLPRCTAPPAPPADRTDCGSDPGQPSEGTRFRLPTSLAMPAGLTPFAQMVFRALQTYGMVVTDLAGGVEIQSETQADWHAEGHAGVDPISVSWQGKVSYGVLDGMPWPELQVVTSPA